MPCVVWAGRTQIEETPKELGPEQTSQCPGCSQGHRHWTALPQDRKLLPSPVFTGCLLRSHHSGLDKPGLLAPTAGTDHGTRDDFSREFSSPALLVRAIE